MTLLSKADFARGYSKFLAEYPLAMKRVEAITQGVADALGVSLAELRETETARALSDAAAAEGLDGFEFLLHFAIDDDAERNRILQLNREAQERAIGLRW